MSATVKWCPACGAEYIATATACADCRVALVDEQTGDDLLDDDEALAYDLADWDEPQRAELVALLEADGIPYAWDGDELIVGVADDAAVEGLIDGIDFPDALDPDDSPEADVDTVPDLLSDLFVAADRLQSNPEHTASVMAMLESAEAAPDLPVPFGIEPPAWEGVLELVTQLADALAEDAEAPIVRHAAKTLRDTLRPFV